MVLLGPLWAPNPASPTRRCPSLPLQASSGAYPLMEEKNANRSYPQGIHGIVWESRIWLSQCLQDLGSRILKKSFCLQRLCPREINILYIFHQSPQNTHSGTMHSLTVTTLTLSLRELYNPSPLPCDSQRPGPTARHCHVTDFGQQSVSRHEGCQVWTEVVNVTVQFGSASCCSQPQ